MVYTSSISTLFRGVLAGCTMGTAARVQAMAYLVNSYPTPGDHIVKLDAGT